MQEASAMAKVCCTLIRVVALHIQFVVPTFRTLALLLLVDRQRFPSDGTSSTKGTGKSLKCATLFFQASLDVL